MTRPHISGIAPIFRTFYSMASSQGALLYTDMTPNKWDIADAEKRTNGSMSAWVTTHKGGRSPMCQLIEGTVAFDAGYGVSDDKMSPEDRKEKMLKIQMNVDISAPENAAYINFCAAVDDRVVEYGAANCQKIFKQATMTKDFAAKLYHSLIKLPAPPEPGQPLKSYLPQFRVKINTKDFVTDKNGAQKVNPNKTKIFVATSKTTYKRADTSILVKGCRVLPIVSMSSIWVSGMSFGINVVANEILVWPTDSQSSSAFNFVLPAPMTLVEDVPRQMSDIAQPHGASAGGASAGNEDDDSMDM